MIGPARPSFEACPLEDDVLALVSIGQWPARADEALVAHASTCDVCRELAMAAAAVIEWRDDADTGTGTVRVPDASLVWYRAQMQARREATARAARPMLVAQLVAATCVAGLAFAWFTTGATGLSAWWQWLTGLVPSTPQLVPAEATLASRLAGPAVIAGAAGLLVLVVAAIGFYLADVHDPPQVTRTSRGG
jgi:predicted anti-sigma-YlaC factor YlaD